MEVEIDQQQKEKRASICINRKGDPRAPQDTGVISASKTSHRVRITGRGAVFLLTLIIEDIVQYGYCCTIHDQLVIRVVKIFGQVVFTWRKGDIAQQNMDLRRCRVFVNRIDTRVGISKVDQFLGDFLQTGPNLRTKLLDLFAVELHNIVSSLKLMFHP